MKGRQKPQRPPKRKAPIPCKLARRGGQPSNQKPGRPWYLSSGRIK